MKTFSIITSSAVVIREENIDTDQIYPARFLKITTRENCAGYLFHDWRFDGGGKFKKNEYFNQSSQPRQKILIVGNNFGCGSSREHAVWALADYGFTVIISTGFGEIFYTNALKNGLLPVKLKPEELEETFRIIGKEPGIKVSVDLEKQTVRCGSTVFRFPIDSFRKMCLLKGVDDIGYIRSFENTIHTFEKSHKIFISV